MNILKFTQQRSNELAEYLEFVASSPLSFEGEHPIEHSSYNHIHLWKLEYLSKSHKWIDIEYKVEFINYIFEQWRRRLKGLSPYIDRGYRVYLYEDTAPTISVVAETNIGFPYEYGVPIFVNSVREILEIYESKNWSDNFSDLDWEVDEKHILNVIEHNKGSIGKPSANKLGLSVGKLRTLITNMGLDNSVNSIRKKYKRRPADFSKEQQYSENWHVFERILRGNYS